MLEIKLQKNLGERIMTVSGSEHDGEECNCTCMDFREQMIMYNNIPGLLRFNIKLLNNHKVYEYCINGMETLQSVCDRKRLGKNDISAILTGVLGAVSSGLEFLLLENDYLIRPDTVFIDADSSIKTAYYSGNGVGLRQSLNELADFIMQRVDYTDDEAVILIYTFYMKTKEENITLDELIAAAEGKVRLHAEEQDCGPEQEPVWKRPAGAEKALKAERHAVTEEAVKTERSAVTEDTVETEQPSVCGHKPFLSFAGTDEKTEIRSFSAGHYDDEREYEIHEIERGDREPAAEPVSFGEIYGQAGRRQKLAALLIIVGPAAAAAVCMVLPFMRNAMTGRPDAFRLVLLAAAALLTAFVGEKMYWRGFARRLHDSFEAANRDSGEETVLLFDRDETKCPLALVSDEYPAIKVYSFPFFIGKEASRVDYVLDHLGVSRYHAKIDRTEDGAFALSDLNSMNGTYVNDERLTSRIPKKISRGDKITIGPCVFFFN